VGVSYYDALLPVREPGPGLRAAMAGLRLPYRVHASVGVPAGRIVVAFVSDSTRLSHMFATNWAQARTGLEPDATLYALAGPACRYGLDESLDRARWWSADHKVMVVFGSGSYRLVKVCMRGICSAVTGDDLLCLHGCTLSVGAGADRRGVIITGGSGAGKTTLAAMLLSHREYQVAVLNDDWGAVSLDSGASVGTGERMLHMKSSSVQALCPGFFGSAPAGSYLPDLSEPDRAARILVPPDRVYGAVWSTTPTVVEQVAVIVREPTGWSPPAQGGQAVIALENEGGLGSVHHHEAFFNGSLILTTEDDRLREERRYRRLLGRTTVSWINNCGTPEALLANFISAVMK
jgi:CobW/HypB/UreG family nucleotide-binding protein